MQKPKLKGRLFFLVSLCFVILIIILNIRMSTRFLGFSHLLLMEKLDSDVNTLNQRLDESRDNTRTAAVSMSRNPEAIKAIREGDREEIIRLFHSAHDLFRVNYFTITDSAGVVLARTHEPDRYGDSVLGQRNVRDALEGKVSSYYEAGTVVKISVRTGAPVLDADGTLIGVVSAGLRFDTNETVDTLKKQLNADVTVFLGDTRIATTVMQEGHRAEGTIIDPEIAKVVIEDQREYIGEIKLFGQYFETYYKPLLNSENETFAIIVLGIPIDDLKSESDMLLREVIVIGIMGIGLALILLYSLRNAVMANMAKSSFLANMSHEIRTPMNVILGITEIQLRNQNLDEGMKDALRRIYSSGDLLLNIINDILDLSKIEADKLEIQFHKYDTASLINDTTTLNMMRIGSKNIEFRLELDENMPSALIGDELRVRQILNNLLSNAFKYTEKGDVTLSVSFERGSDHLLSGRDEEVTLVFRVTDTGQGMTREQVNKLFSRYTRFNMEANRKTEGTGLGMSITKKLVEMMNGSIHVESEAGKGSTFTVRLPQEGAGPEVLGRELAESLKTFRLSGPKHVKGSQLVYEPMPYGKVMVVDDVESNLFVAKGLMAPYGLKIETAMSGFEAVEKIREGNVYDILFMDHMMPGMDGIEATGRIRALGYTEPVIALTANAVAGQSDMFLENGFDDFISKPIDVRQLNAVLKKYVRDKQPPAVIEEARRLDAEQTQKAMETAGKLEVSAQFAEIFIRDATKATAALMKILEKSGAYDDEELQLYTINVHGLKSTLANIGEQKLSDFAARLEQAGKAKDTAAIASETRVFLEELRAIVEKLTPVKEDEDEAVEAEAVAGSGEDCADLREKLEAVKEACESFDEKTAKETIDALRQKTWPSPTNEALKEMAEHLSDGDYDAVWAAADKIIEAG